MFVLQYIFENACVRRISSQKSAAQIMPREHSLDLRCHRLDRWVTIAMDADRPAVAFVGLAGFTKLMQAVNHNEHDCRAIHFVLDHLAKDS